MCVITYFLLFIVYYIGRELYTSEAPPLILVFSIHRFFFSFLVTLAFTSSCLSLFHEPNPVAEEMLPQVPPHTFLAYIPVVPYYSGFSSNFKELFYGNVILGSLECICSHYVSPYPSFF